MLLALYIPKINLVLSFLLSCSHISNNQSICNNIEKNWSLTQNIIVSILPCIYSFPHFAVPKCSKKWVRNPKEQKNHKIKTKSCFTLLFGDIFLYKDLKLPTETVHMHLFFVISLHILLCLSIAEQ